MRQLKIAKQLTNREDLSLDKYLAEIAKEKLISIEEELELAQRIKRGDKQALEQLVRANLRFVVSVAKQYQHQGLKLTDLINEGNLGLIKAAEKFDETRGFKFISYAVWWIRQSILQAVAEQSRIVRIPLNVVGSLKKINSSLSRFEQENGTEASPEEISDLIGISAEKINHILRSSNRHTSFDAPFIGGGENNCLLDLLCDQDAETADSGLMNESLKQEIQKALSFLDEREEKILRMFFGIGCREQTLDEIGKTLGLTQERVRQIKEKSLRKLKKMSRCKVLQTYYE